MPVMPPIAALMLNGSPETPEEHDTTMQVDQSNNAPATTPKTPAALPIIMPVALGAPFPVLVPLLEPVADIAATWMPKPVDVTVVVEPPVVTVLVTTEVAVVEAVQPDQLVHGASVAQVPLVQPDHVEPGQPAVPHQFVHAPLVQAPVLWLAHGPQPLPAPPKGPTPFEGFQPGAPPQPGRPVTVAHSPFVGHALPPVDEFVS